MEHIEYTALSAHFYYTLVWRGEKRRKREKAKVFITALTTIPQIKFQIILFWEQFIQDTITAAF